MVPLPFTGYVAGPWRSGILGLDSFSWSKQSKWSRTKIKLHSRLAGHKKALCLPFIDEPCLGKSQRNISRISKDVYIAYVHMQWIIKDHGSEAKSQAIMSRRQVFFIYRFCYIHNGCVPNFPCHDFLLIQVRHSSTVHPATWSNISGA